MRFDLDRLPTDPVVLQKILSEMAEAMELERVELQAANVTVKAQSLKIENLEHRLARLLRVQFGLSSAKIDIGKWRRTAASTVDIATRRLTAAPDLLNIH